MEINMLVDIFQFCISQNCANYPTKRNI